MWGPRPYSLAEIVYEYETEGEGQRGYERDSQDRFFENHTHPLHQYLAYLEDGSRRRHVLTDTGDEVVYSQWQPGLELEGWRITTTSDQANHPSETKHIRIGTRRLTLDHTA